MEEKKIYDLQLLEPIQKTQAKTNLLSVLFPVLLSTTLDFAKKGLARLIKCSHSSFDCSQ